MHTNLVLFDADGNALYGCSVAAPRPTRAAAHTAYLACWVADTLALLHARGITEVAVVQFEPERGGDYASSRAIECHTLKLELRRTPSGARELVGLCHVDVAAATHSTRAAGAAVRSVVPQGRGHRVLHSTLPGLAATATLCSRGEPLAAAAARHRAHNPRAWNKP